MGRLKDAPKTRSRQKYIAAPDVLEAMIARLRGPSLKESFPKLSREWHSKLNGTYTPRHFGPGSSYKAWWRRKCASGEVHVFCSAVSTRVRALKGGSRFAGCSICSGRTPKPAGSLEAASAVIAREWLEKENNFPTSRLITNSRKLGLWRCSNLKEVRGHKKRCNTVFSTKVCARTHIKNPQHCPKCFSGERVNLDRDYPSKVRRLYVTSKENLGFSSDRLPASYRVFWRCPDKHLWYERFEDLKKRHFNCPTCCLEDAGTLAEYPQLATQFYAKLNDGLTARRINIKGASDLVLTWKCDQAPDHVWQARLYSRVTLGTGCPYCTKRRLTASNSLANFPEIARELDSEANGHLNPEDILANTTKSYGFLCSSCGWRWRTQVRLRTQRGYGCPKCKRKKTARS